MNDLQSIVNMIKNQFPQESILLKEFNSALDSFIEKPNPKYLFRGEKIYPNTKSNYHRLSINENDREVLHEYMMDISVALAEKYFEIDPTNRLMYQQVILHLGDFLQHYGFPIMRLDFTEDVEVAAFFACYKNDTGKGRIWIVETETLIISNEALFKSLDNKFANRAIIQKAFELRMFDDKPDFQNSEHFQSRHFDFNISAEDKQYFTRLNLLTTKGDDVSDFIINYIETNMPKESYLKGYMTKILTELKANRD